MRGISFYCGVGGDSVGYSQAGIEMVGVDLNWQGDYPFEFYQADTLVFIREHWEWIKANFDFVHASAPCHDHTALAALNAADGTGPLLWQTRVALDGLGLPWVMENVQGSPLRKDVVLCGEMFGLGVIRHRVFEFGGGVKLEAPAEPVHRGRVRGCRHGVWFDGPYVAVYGQGGGKGSVEEWREAMGIDWTWDRKGIANAVPPAYTRWIGEGLMEVLG